MKLIAESINVMSQSLGPAMKERNAPPIEDMARKQTEAGVDLLDLNIGPARKQGDELMAWITEVVQNASDLQLSLDTTNMDAMEAGLKVAKQRPLINSVSLQPDRMARGIGLAKQYNAEMIGLLWGADGMPRDSNERAMHTVNLLLATAEAGVPNEDVWIDPIVSPVSVEINQVKSCVEFMMMLEEIAPGCKSTCGLSNISNGAPTHLRPWLNRTYMIMLMRYGLHSAIVDAFDVDLIKIARGERQDLVELVHNVMDGDAPSASALSVEQVKYLKTAKVLVGESLYSDSWLEI
jgi:5-methyltetrahydrofolate corrinoid/iron sulfur protein methyltransferase